MSIYFLLIALATSIFVIAVIFLIIQVRSGQLDDLDTPPLRMLADDDFGNGHESEHESENE